MGELSHRIFITDRTRLPERKNSSTAVTVTVNTTTFDTAITLPGYHSTTRSVTIVDCRTSYLTKDLKENDTPNCTRDPGSFRRHFGLLTADSSPYETVGGV